MTVNVFNPVASVTLTDSAQKYFSKKLANQSEKLIRISTKVSGCTGFAYVLDIIDTVDETDIVIPFDGGRLAVAAESMPVLSGTEIDLVQEGVNEVITYHNPNVVDECGCGQSFSVS